MKRVRRAVGVHSDTSTGEHAAAPALPRKRPRWSLRVYLLALIALFVAAAIGGGAYISLQAVNQAHQTASVDTSFAAKAASAALATDVAQVEAGSRRPGGDPWHRRPTEEPGRLFPVFQRWAP